jgi:DNA-binding HxlR family transcriptional regulator
MPRRRAAPAAAAPPELARSHCPIASTLDLVGDKWTLLVVRDLAFTEKRRFADFLASPEGISTNILADRLARLEAAGLVERRPYQERPPRHEYHLTAKGRDLRAVLVELIRWGNRNLPGTYEPPPEALEGEDRSPGVQGKKR